MPNIHNCQANLAPVDWWQWSFACPARLHSAACFAEVVQQVGCAMPGCAMLALCAEHDRHHCLCTIYRQETRGDDPAGSLYTHICIPAYLQTLPGYIAVTGARPVLDNAWYAGKLRCDCCNDCAAVDARSRSAPGAADKHAENAWRVSLTRNCSHSCGQSRRLDSTTEAFLL